MRASTVFILALALLIGLAVAAAAKSAGLFNKKEIFNPDPPKPVPTRVLVARANIFEDLTVTADQVYVRELHPQEEANLQRLHGSAWQSKLLPPLPSAAILRTAKQNIPADTILMRDMFFDASLPPGQTAQLEPNTRPVNVSVAKEKAAGGVVRVNEYVDVFLTTRVAVGDRDELRTACIARACKVIMKRNMIWQVAAADPDNKPLHFTLQANVYRAALLDFAQGVGSLSLFPVKAPAPNNGVFSDPSSPEYANEDQRIDEMNRGTRSIGNDDLARIFKITAAPAPAPRELPKQIVIPHISGVQYAGATRLTQVPPGPTDPVSTPVKPLENDTATPPAPRTGETSQPGYTFRLPNATGESGSGCKSCDEKKKREAEEAARRNTIRPPGN